MLSFGAFTALSCYHRYVDRSPSYQANKTSPAGRDKILRSVQYFSRLYSWYLHRAQHSQNGINFQAISNQFEVTRKILRIGTFIEKFNAASTAYKRNSTDALLRYLTVAHHIGYGGYLALDNIIAIDAAGVRKLATAKKLKKLAYRSWMAGLICSIVAGIYSLCKLQRKKDIEGTAEAKRTHTFVPAQLLFSSKLIFHISRARYNTSAQLVANLCDLTLPISVLGYAALGDGVVGMAGTISSLIGVWFQWQKTAMIESQP